MISQVKNQWKLLLLIIIITNIEWFYNFMIKNLYIPSKRTLVLFTLEHKKTWTVQMKKSKINVGVVNRKKKLIQKIKNTKFQKKIFYKKYE